MCRRLSALKTSEICLREEKNRTKMGLGLTKIKEIVRGMDDKGEAEEEIFEAPTIQEENSVESDAIPVDITNIQHTCLHNETSQQQERPPTPVSPSEDCAGGKSNGCSGSSDNFSQQRAAKTPVSPSISFTQNIANNNQSSIVSNQIGYVDNLHIGNVINLGEVRNEYTSYQEQRQPAASSSPPYCNSTPTSEDIMDFPECDQPVNRDILLYISRLIGYSWKKLGRELGLEEETMEAVDLDNQRYGLQEIVFKMLEEWWRSDHDNATIGKLASALRAANRNDLVLKLKSHLESEQ